MIELTEEQRQDILEGKPVRVAAPDLGSDCVVLRADVYDWLRSIAERPPDHVTRASHSYFGLAAARCLA